MSSGRVLLVCCALSAGAAFALTRYVDSNVLAAAVAVEQKALADFKADQYDVVVESLRVAVAERDTLQGRLSTIDADHSNALKAKQNEIDTLADRVGRGPVRLLVRATCPTPAGTADVPQAPEAGRVDPSTRPELDADARQDYFALRRGIAVTEETLAACQAALSASSQ